MFLGTFEYAMDPKVMPVHHELIWRGLPIVVLTIRVAPVLVLIGVWLGSIRREPLWSMLWIVQATDFLHAAHPRSGPVLDLVLRLTPCD